MDGRCGIRSGHVFVIQVSCSVGLGVTYPRVVVGIVDFNSFNLGHVTEGWVIHGCRCIQTGNKF